MRFWFEWITDRHAATVSLERVNLALAIGGIGGAGVVPVISADATGKRGPENSTALANADAGLHVDQDVHSGNSGCNF